MLNEISLFIDQ